MDVDEALALFWREVKGSSLRRVAKSANVSYSTASLWKGDSKPTGENREKLIAWASALPVTYPTETPPPQSVREYDSVIATVIATGENRARLGMVQGYAQFVLDQLVELARKQQAVVDGIRPFAEAEGQALAANVSPEQIPELLASIRRYQSQTPDDAPADPRRGTG